MRKFFGALLVLICPLTFTLSRPALGKDNLATMLELVGKIKDPSIGETAASQLEELVKSQPSLRSDLLKQLRPIIRAGPGGGKAAWMNSTRVAGDLKLSELAPDLAAWVDRGGSAFLGIGPLHAQYPAGTALAKLGDASIPALLHVAETGSESQWYAAPMFISWIGTPAARRALKTLIKKETDPKKKERLELLLKAAKTPRDVS